jgi:sodium/proline symporter
MNYEFWLPFFIYFGLLFGIAFSVHKKNATTADMLVGNRTLNFWVTALSAQASDMSSWLFMAFPMAVFLGGLPQIWIAVSLVIGMFCTWHFVAPQLRTLTESYNCYTLSSYFAKRYGDPKGYIRIISSIMMLLYMTYYLAAGLISIGFLFGSIFELDYMTGVMIATVVMMSYTFIGGFISVAWADLFQAIFLLGAILVVPLIAFGKVGGIAGILSAAEASNIPMNLFSASSEISFKEILFPLSWGLGYFGMPHILVKFMGIKNVGDMKKAKYLGISWQILALSAAALVGLIAIPYFANGINNSELVFVEMVKELFHPVSAGLVLCGLLAATISTMDSQILVSASVLTEDVYKHFFKPKIGSRAEVVIFRISVVLVSVIALWIASGQNSTIMDTVYYAWAGLGCTFGPLLLSSIYSKKPNYYGALAGLLTGGLSTTLWPSINRYLLDAGILDAIPSMLVGFPLSLAAIFVVSHYTKSKA